jgi:hypothetical protein
MGRLTVYYIIQSDGIVLFWIDQDYKIVEDRSRSGYLTKVLVNHIIQD